MKPNILFFTIIILLFRFAAFSQAGEWTWVKGSDFTSPTPNFGTQGIEAPGNEPPGFYEAANWTDTTGNFWLFGGVDSFAEEWGDLWRFNPQTGNWTWMTGLGQQEATGNYGIQGVPSTGNSPPSIGWGVPTWVDYNGNLWLFGGVNSVIGSLSDMWRYTIATNSWTWMQGPGVPDNLPVYGTLGVESSGNTPGGRAECAATWVDTAGNFWLYGGEGNFFGCFGDLWEYHTATNNWIWMGGNDSINTSAVYGTTGVASAGNYPGGRMVYCSWSDSAGNFWLYGGAILDSISFITYDISVYNDMWKYEPATGNWTWMAGTDNLDDEGNYGALCSSAVGLESSARIETRSRWKDGDGNFWFFGGARGGDFDTVYNDLWNFNPASLKWTFVNGSDSAGGAPTYGTEGIAAAANTPGGRAGSDAWFSKSGELYLYGGTVNGWPSPYNDVWKFTIDTACGDLSNCTLVLQPVSINTSCGQNNGSASVITGSGTAPYTYNWNNGSTSDSLSGIPAGTYTVTVMDFMGCSASVNAIVNSSSNGNVNITAGDTSICPGDSTTLCAPSGFNVYHWNTGDSTECITTKLAGYYYLTVSDNGSCTVTSNRVTVNVLPAPPVTISIAGDTLIAYDAVTYQWYYDSMQLQGDTDSILVANRPGTYSVAVSDSNGCLIMSNNQIISGINNLADEMSLKLYPDPATDELNVAYNLNKSANLQISIMDITGQRITNVINEKELNGSYLQHINIRNLASAVYILNFTTDSGSVNLKFVKE